MKSFAVVFFVVLFASLGTAKQKDPCAATPPTSIEEDKPPVEGATSAGDVCLFAVVDASGSVREVKILRGVQRDVDKAAVMGIKKWKFTPAKKDGQPVTVQVAILVKVWRNADGQLIVPESNDESVQKK